jgi:hypothetical protein
MALTRKNLMVDDGKVRELARRLGTSESEAVRRAVDGALGQDDLSRLQFLYRIDDTGGVGGYIRRHPEIVPLLEEARGQMTAIFGSTSQARLELLLDPEEGSESLFAIVVVPGLPPAEAWARLDRFDEDWLLDATPRIRGLFNVHVGFDADAV